MLRRQIADFVTLNPVLNLCNNFIKDAVDFIFSTHEVY